MKHILILLTVLALTLLLTSCDNITEQPDATPGSRNYEWTIDTVFSEIDTSSGLYNYNGKIWGSSFDDLWYLAPYTNELWKKSGQNWERVIFTVPFYPIRQCSFTNNTFMLFSSSGSYCLYDGSSFGEIKNIPGESIWISGVYGTSSDDIYVVGGKFRNSIQHSLFMHYDGSKWNEIATDFQGDFSEIAKKPNTNYLIRHHDPYLGSQILEYDGNDFKIFSNGYYDFVPIGSFLYFASGSSFYKYDNGKIYSWKSFRYLSSGGSIAGRNESDIFFERYYGIGHYNGINEVDLFYLNNSVILDAAIGSSEVCFLAYNYDTYQVQVIRGVQK